MYCGNNLLHASLTNGTSVLGTRYECLRKGIGTGLNLPLDIGYLGQYQPVDARRMYCGNRDNIPIGYDYVGNLAQCLQKGVGIGKKMKAEDAGDIQMGITRYKVLYKTVLSIFIAGVLFGILYTVARFAKPKIFFNQNDKDKIKWKTFLIIYFSILTPMLIFVYLKAFEF